MSSNKSIARSAGIIGSATLLSRILGFIRDMIFAAFFGTGMYAESFVVAFRIPNLLRDLIGEGATNAAVVPILVEELSGSGRDKFWKLANILLNLILVILTVLTLSGFILSRPIVIAIAPGFIADPVKLDITINLTRAIFPYLVLIGLAAYCMGVLNSIKHFTTPAYGPAVLNIALIVCMLVWRQDIIGLVAGVLLGGLLQVAIQVPPLLKSGMVFDQRAFIHPKVKKIGRLLIPRVFGTGIYQINVFFSTVLASIGNIAGEGAVAALYFSNRILQFPLAIFAIALAQAALPTLSGHIASNDMERFRKSINFQLRTISFILVPASAGLISLAAPITKVLWERGAFDVYSTNITAYALLFYAFGLLSYGVIKILVGAFYSMQDTKTPVKVAAVSLVVNIVLNLILMFPLKVGGLALATSVSGTVNAAILLVILKRRLATFYEKQLLGSFLKILISSAIMGIFASWCYGYMTTRIFESGRLYAAIGLAVTIAASTVFYIILCHILKVDELKELKRWILKRR